MDDTGGARRGRAGRRALKLPNTDGAQPGSTGTEPVRALIGESLAVYRRLLADEQLHGEVASLVDLCVATLQAGGKIIFAGNGGSFADAQHLATEFASRFQLDRTPLAAIALATNGSSISATANDFGYEQVFARELLALGAAGDLFIPISTSGNSANLLAAVQIALQKGISVVGLTGATGGKLAALGNCIRVPATVTSRIQESHILLGHIVCGLTEARLFPDAGDGSPED